MQKIIAGLRRQDEALVRRVIQQMIELSEKQRTPLPFFGRHPAARQAAHRSELDA